MGTISSIKLIYTLCSTYSNGVMNGIMSKGQEVHSNDL